MKYISFSIVCLLTSFLLLICSCNSGKQKNVGLAADTLKAGEKPVFFENGKLHYIVEMKNGKANGRVREYNAQGLLFMDATFKDGQRDGKCKRYYTNGRIFSETNYIKGSREGVETRFYPDGKTSAIATYKKDKIQPGLKEFRKDGTEMGNDVTLIINEVNHSKLEGKFYITVKLSVPQKGVKYYASPQEDPDSREILKISGDAGILNVPLQGNRFILKKLLFEAKYTTRLGNTMRLQKPYTLVVN